MKDKIIYWCNPKNWIKPHIKKEMEAEPEMFSVSYFEHHFEVHEQFKTFTEAHIFALKMVSAGYDCVLHSI